MPYEQERRHVGPVQVVEHEEQARRLGGGAQHLRDGNVQAVAVGVRIGRLRVLPLARGCLNIRKKPRQLSRRHPLELLARAATDELVECLQKRPVRDTDGRVAPARQDQHAVVRGRRRKLAGQAGLAGSGLARDERHATAFTRGAGEQRAQQGQLSRAADERERECVAEGPREVGHALDSQL